MTFYVTRSIHIECGKWYSNNDLASEICDRNLVDSFSIVLQISFLKTEVIQQCISRGFYNQIILD